MDYSHRLRTLQNKLSLLKIQAFLVSDLSNIRYLTGFTGSAALCLVTRWEAILITDARYDVQAKEEVAEAWEVLVSKRGFWKDVATLLKKDSRVTKVGFEARALVVASYENLTKLAKPKILVSCHGFLESLRVCKSSAEIEILTEAAQKGDACFAHALEVISPELTEQGLARALENHMLEIGADGPSFPTIVASGVRGALPHAHPSKNLLSNGLVTIDMGVIYQGYCSDCTRTYCLGKPTQQQQDIYKAVHEAEQAAIAACVPGVSAKEIDAVARAVLKKYTVDAFFTHALGHGVGLDIHEEPVLSHRSKAILQPGMVITIEPGVYKKGWGGVRIEDMLLITDGAPRLLTQATNTPSLTIL